MAFTRLLRAAVVLSCVVALGMSAATMESTLTTGPLDGRDPNWSELPLSEEEAADLKDALDVREELGLEEDLTVNQTPEPEPLEQTPPPADVDVAGGEGRADGTDSGSGPQVAVNSPTQADDDPIGRLIGLLKLVVLVAAIGVAYRYRQWLEAPLLGLLAGIPAHIPARGAEGAKSPGRPLYTPEHEVDQAWLEVIRELDPEDVRSRTPAECARAAEAAGLPSEPVQAIRQTFEEVRYGGKPVTDDRRRRVRQGLQALPIKAGPP